MPRSVLYGASIGSGPDLVLLHPIGLDHAFWGALPQACAADHRVLALDLRGHGRSPAARPGLTMDDYVEDVRLALTERGIGRAVVLGLSFGGMIAQELAIRHPDLVSRLVLCGCPGAIAPEFRDAIRERGLAADRGGMAAVAEATIDRWFTPPFRGDAAVQRVRERLLADDPGSWSAGWHAIAGFDALPRLGEIRVPATVVAGDQDLATPLATARTLAAAIPGAELEILPGAPHMMQLEAEAAFMVAVGRILSSGAASLRA